MFEGDKINNFEVGTIAGLKQIHWFLFQYVFEFAGELRGDERSASVSRR